MNIKIPPFYIIVIACLLFSVCNAQKVFIATDFGACGVGLRDSSGKWLAEPIYTSISKVSTTYYEVLYGSKEGIIDSTGKIIIPAIYDYVSTTTLNIKTDKVQRYVFEVSIDNKSGLLNEQNQFIIPIICRDINVNEDGDIVAEKRKKHYSLYTLDGKETIIPNRQGTMPATIGEKMYVVSRNSFGLEITRHRRYSCMRPRLIRRIFNPRIRIRIKKKYGVMNDSLRIIIPKQFSEVSYSPGIYKLISVKKKKKTGYFSLEGKEIWKADYIINYNFQWMRYYGGGQSVINAYGYTAASSKGKYGIIGVKGDTLLPFIYESIYRNNNADFQASQLNWYVSIHNKTGIYDPQNKKWVLEPVYESINPIAAFRTEGDTTLEKGIQQGGFNNSYYYNNYSDDGGGLIMFIAKKDKKYGIVTNAGQEILPFNYDYYFSAYEGFIFRKDTNFTMVSIPKQTIFRNSYPAIVQTKLVQIAPSDLLFKKVTVQGGTTLIINSELLSDSTQLMLYQNTPEGYLQNAETYHHQLHSTAVIISEMKPNLIFPGITQAYRWHSSNLNYLPENETEDFVLSQQFTFFQALKLNTEAKDDFHTYYSVGYSRGIFREDGKWIMHPHNYSSCYVKGKTNGLAYFSIDVGRNKMGLIYGNGKLLLDTVWGNIGPHNGKYFWVKEKDYRYFYGRNYYHWDIYDTTTHEMLLPRKLRSGSVEEFGNIGVIIERKEGKKLFNIEQRKFILTGNIQDIFKLDTIGNYFAVRTCYGHIGIIDANGKWLTDTIWTAIIDANNTSSNTNNYYYRSADYHKYHPYNYCVLSNDTGWIIYNGFKGTVSKSYEEVQYLLKTSLNSITNDSIKGITKFCADCPSYSYSPLLKNKPTLQRWQETLLFDSLFTGETFIADTNYSWYMYKCKDCEIRNRKEYFRYTWSKNYDKETLHHTISFSNDSCISVSREDLGNYRRVSKNPKDLFFTLVLFEDGPHTFLLDSLFQGNDWKAFISEEVTLYLESKPYIIGNCHNPTMLPFVLKDRFILTENGIELFPPNFIDGFAQLSVPISWEKLKPYMRKDIIRKLGI